MARGAPVAAISISQEKLDLVRRLAPDGFVNLSHFSGFRYEMSSAAFLRTFVPYLKSLPITSLLTVGRRDRKALDFDLAELGLPVRRFEIALLPNKFEGSLLTYIGYVVDTIGPYFDGSVPTELEEGLNQLESGWWHDDQQAVAFLSEYLGSDVQKYIPKGVQIDEIPGGGDTLVLGQVTGDQAVMYTEGDIKDNVSLVGQTVLEHKDLSTLIYYKPHPRNPSNTNEIETITYRFGQAVRCLAPDSSFLDAIVNKPRVVTMSSGAGLEAAVRGCDVTVHLTSFYSNWGFTDDRTRCSRRRNKLTVEDVFLYFYTRYSHYIHPFGDGEISPLEALRGKLNGHTSRQF